MTVDDLLATLQQQHVQLWVEGDQLRYRAPEGTITESLRAALVQQKHEIMLRLNQPHRLAQLTPDPAQRHQPFPLNEIQQAYWIGRRGIFEISNVSTHVYLEINGQDLDLQRLSHAWRKVIDRHAMLRAIVHADGQQQILETVSPYEIAVLDLCAESETAIASQLATIRQQMSHQVRQPEQWPLFEICASRLDDRTTRLHISIDGLIADGRSLFLLFQDWGEWYRNPARSLPTFQLSFRDYVLAEVALQESSATRTALTYWRGRLVNLPPAPALPLARNPGTLTHPRFVRQSDRLAPDTWNRLKSSAKQNGLTPSGVLLAAYAQVLATWSKSLQFTLNVTLSNRLPLHPQANEIVGVFSSINLLEVDYSQPDSFANRSQRLQQQLWQDLDHHQLSGIRVLRELAQLRQTGVSAQMPVVFTSTLLDLSQLGWMGEIVDWITQTPQVWLDCQVYEQDGALIFSWDAVEDLFPPGLLPAMFEAYQTLLQQLADQPETWQQSRFSLLPVEQLQQRAEINATAASVPDQLLHTLFNRQAAQQPDQIAVIADDRSLTYGELYRQSQAIGRWLRQRGACPNQLVAVVMAKGWEQIVAVLGVLQSGAAYLPIDPTLPLERLHYLLSDGETNLVLTQSNLRYKLALPDSFQCLSVDTDKPLEIDSPLEPIQSPDDLAYVIYTSGSTGTPKGVMIAHRGVVNAIAATNQHFEVSAADRVLGLTALHHDMSVYDIFGILAVGGTIVLPEAPWHRDPAHWLELMHQHQVSVWNSVPAMMEMLLESISGLPLQGQPVLPRSLRLAFLGGDWIPLSLPERLHSLAETVKMISVGGPTETTLWNIWHPIEQVDPDWQSIPYGRPIANTRYYVLNQKLEPSPVWVPGQFYCAGVGLAKGYWRDQEKTNARFIQHPQTGERLYQTGDLGRYLPNGSLEFLGREDFQLKINGLRIEPGEIETALSKHPLVKSAVVIAVQLGSRKSLIAYIVPKNQALSLAENTAVSPEFPLKRGTSQAFSENWDERFRQYLSEQLPPALVPASFVLLNQLPLTANGKVDRQALAKLEYPLSKAVDADHTPRNPIEARLAVIWAELLGLEQISIHDDFFQLGGNSLLAVQLVTRIIDAFQVELPLHRLFESPTISSLSPILENLQGDVTSGILHSELDLLSEAVLDAGIYPGSSAVCSVVQPQSILLTGATGYLGAFLLHELLHRTNATVYCLVRSDSIASGKARLQSNLAFYLLWDEAFSDRIIPVLGDLSQPLLGLTQEQFGKLATEIDSIYHNGAQVNFTYPYSALKAANVLGTQEVLRLAAQQKTKPTHFVSTTHVFPGDPKANARMILETMIPEQAENLPTGYVQSKWVAERLIGIARQRGLPVSIYRPSLIVGHQQTGAGNSQDLLFRMIKGCLQLGMAPDIDLSFNLVPVDYVSQAIVHLSTQPESLGNTFHLVNPHQTAISWSQILQWLQQLGCDMQPIPYPQWLTVFQNSGEELSNNSLYPLLPVFLAASGSPATPLLNLSHEILFDCQNTLSGLADTRLTCPPITVDWLSRYLSFFSDRGILPPDSYPNP
jgi:amino acid adenylation domain-containing protein/thioester reductase-like protein